MDRSAVKLGIALLGMPLSVLALGLTHEDVFFFAFMVAFILSILYWKDYGRILRSDPEPTRLRRTLGIIMGVPQAFFGLLCCAIGAAMIIWVLYNSLIARDPAYSGGFLSFGLGPAFILFGVAWLRSTFGRDDDGAAGGA